MNRDAIKSLLKGLVVLAVLFIGLVMYLDYSRSRVTAQHARIETRPYVVGTDYTGVITKQFITQGDKVTAGQPLFYIKSGVLVEQMRESKLTPDDLLYPLTEENEIILQAARPGVVSEIHYTEGSFVPANKEVATIIDTTAMRVKATYHLTAPDYARVSQSTRMQVELPDGQTALAQIVSIRIVEQNELIVAELEAEVHSLESDQLKTASGTPVASTLYFEQTSLPERAWGVLRGVMDKVVNVATR